MKKRIILRIISLIGSLFLAVLILVSSTISNVGVEDYILDTEAEYLAKYADTSKYTDWMRTNITNADYPPVDFKIDNREASSLTWKKSVSNKRSFIDYETTDMPAKRICYTVSFACREYDIAVDLFVTEYPGYPVVDYEAVLKNNGSTSTPVIRDLCSYNGIIYDQAGDMTVRYWNGSSVNGLTDYNEHKTVFCEDGSVYDNTLSIYVDNGKPTSVYLPNFNIESEDGDGGISILSWQGNWKQTLQYTDSGLSLLAGQYETNFNLLEGETHRFPEMVFIFYKEDEVYGQNIYRRWFWKHNFMREEGFRYGDNVLFSTGAIGSDIKDTQSTAVYDKIALGMVEKYEFYEQVDRFAQDAGWTDYKDAQTWFEGVGNWELDTVRYPNGLNEISEICDEMGLGYTLWMEPERAVSGTDFADLHPEWVIYYKDVNGIPIYIDAENACANANGLVNLGNENALNYLINMVNDIIKEQGVDIYRLDFNFFPAPYWKAYDNKTSAELGLMRIGRTEEMYCNGYLAFFDALLALNPGLNIDACASGGMRYDLATARRAHCHTRTDWYMGEEKAQTDTYTTSKWMMYWGTGIVDYISDYGIRSRLSLDIGIGVMGFENYDFETYFNEMGAAINEWRGLNSYMLEDYYPLTEQLRAADNGLMAFQYDCPSRGTGIVIGYARGEGINQNLGVYALDPDAIYEWYDLDNATVVYSATGKELMENGFNFKSGTSDDYVNDSGVVCKATVYAYVKK